MNQKNNYGRVWKYGNDINTDYIFPGIYTYVLMNDQEMGIHAMEGCDPAFKSDARPGDIIVAGSNWGCGSSREQAVKCLKERGIAAVIAKSFGRIYYRNALNEGLAIIVCPEAVDGIADGAKISIDFERGVILDGEREYPFPPYTDFVRELVECGGLLPQIRARLKREGRI